jgi:small subunit ribosomal protein S1
VLQYTDQKERNYFDMAKSTKKMSMEELLKANVDKLVVPHKGDTITGVIVEKNKKNLVIDLGSKTEAFVADKEFEFASDFIDDLKVGDEIKAIVVSTDYENGQVLLSLKGAASDAKWEYFEEALDKDLSIEAKGVELNRGGLIVLVNGVRGFVPSSQFGRQYMGKIANLKGETFKVKAIEVDREKNRLIFSERHVSEAKELAQKDLAVESVKEGEVYEGVVSGVMHFGLFVTVEVPVKDESDKDSTGYIEGLIHISEISWEKVNHPRDYHKVGDRITVKVLGIDERTNKLNLSIKQLEEDPWTTLESRYAAGTTFTGKVTRIEPFGVFVNVEKGVDGLIHSTKLDSSKELKVGDEVTVNVENVVPEQRRMSLSIVQTDLPIAYK